MLTVDDTLHVEDFSPISVASNRYKTKYNTKQPYSWLLKRWAHSDPSLMFSWVEITIDGNFHREDTDDSNKPDHKIIFPQ